jgi:hypothetical protein
MKLHVVRPPADSELTASSGKLPNEITQQLVVGVSSSSGAQDRYGVIRHPLPVSWLGALA